MGMTAVVGIDLGTRNSFLAYLDNKGNPRILENEFGENVTPSAVFSDGNETIVGTEAYRMKQSDPGSVATEFKRHMGTDKIYELPGGDMTPVELSAVILKTLGEHAESQLGDLGQVVITTPANSTNSAREATRSAGQLVGFEVGPEINEPTAAALYYSYTQNIAPGIYFVYDFGGGTWDISAVKVEGTTVEVLWSNGIKECGGSDFDTAMGDLIKELYKSETGEEMDESIQSIIYEEVKKTLSQRDQRRVTVQGSSGPPTVITVKREQFEAKISSLVAQTEIICADMLERYPDFEGVFLAGGTTRVPKVEKSVEKVFGKVPLKVANPDEVIALGAAIYSGLKASKDDLNAAQSGKLDSVELKEISNHYFGTDVVKVSSQGQSSSKFNSVVIPKGHSLPCKVAKNYVTTRDNQTSVSIMVTQAAVEETELEKVTVIWEGSLNVPGGRSAGKTIEVTYEYTEDERMKCSFVDVESGLRSDVDLTLSEAEDVDSTQIEKLFVE